ncbi:MAG: EI24 domain-containing protein [Brachymonas sp.]|nr:EI24 domain-containing protein [Brachymonas sp.]
MRNILDALWRALLYCVQPAVILLSLAPLIVVLLVVFAFAYWGWQPAVDAMQGWLQGGMLEAGMLRLMNWLGLAEQPRFLPALLVLCLAIPTLVMGSLLIVTWLSTPALVRLLAHRRFPDLAQKHGGNILASAFWSIGYTVLALAALLISLPLWLLPPLALLIPPLIWGWLVAKLLPYDVLADHASADERRTLFKRHRLELLAMGIITGLLGSAPSLLFASGVIAAALFVILAPLAIWLYTLIFVFSTLWFGHFCLRALERLREEAPVLDAHATAWNPHAATASNSTATARPHDDGNAPSNHAAHDEP